MIYRLRLRITTLLALGIDSLIRVAFYRICCRSGLYRLLLPVRQWQSGASLFTPISYSPAPDIAQEASILIIEMAEAALQGDLAYYSQTMQQVGSPPDWFLDPFSRKRIAADNHWSKLNEFSAGDIKNVWETSRFEWVPLFARAWRLSHDGRYLDAINSWLENWLEKNPENGGPNWKCGQEASIRTINLLLGARLLGCHRTPSPSLVSCVAMHCRRIMPTVGYAIGQNNNHGTSEAAALYIAGLWLCSLKVTGKLLKQSQRWHDCGRRMLENRLVRLVGQDGSFSQYSVNYHRVFLDTICQVELWRKEFNDSSFTEIYNERCTAAVNWLAAMTDDSSGQAPNFGANDGARLYNLASVPYADFRPSVQMGAVIFCGTRRYSPGAWDEPLLWYGINPATASLEQSIESCAHVDGGDIVLLSGLSRAVIRYAHFQFRPSHADCLHIDLWHMGQNILRDGGSYSYNTTLDWQEYFSGTASHNTVQFDGRSQMPRIGRFLFGKWLEMNECTGIQRDGDSLAWTGAYSDWLNSWHRRSIRARGNVWRVIDEIDGFNSKAVLRWRLLPIDWTLESFVCSSTVAQLKITTPLNLKRCELVQGWESLHYQEKTTLPVLEIEVGPGRCTIITEITLKG